MNIENIFPNLPQKLAKRYVEKIQKDVVGTCVSHLEMLSKKVSDFANESLNIGSFNKEKNMIIKSVKSIIDNVSQKLIDSLTYFENLSKTRKAIWIAVLVVLTLWVKKRINKKNSKSQLPKTKNGLLNEFESILEDL